MAKFGKNYRTLQIHEWSTYYLNYKRLKQKIKSIKAKIDKDINDGTYINDINISLMSSLKVIPIEQRISSSNLDDLNILYKRKYGKDLEEFVEILNEEIFKFCSFYLTLEKELYQKVNNHLYTQTNFLSYNLLDIYNEMNNLNKTAFLIKCLNSFNFDNLNALKNILKKFDNKLGKHCGKIEYKYISYQLSLKNSKLKYLLQSKILDEALTICETNLKELYKYYQQNQNRLIYENPIDKNKNLIDKNQERHNNINLFEDLNKDNIKIKITEKRQGILKLLKEADEFVYFKIQYGDWFYFKDEFDYSMKRRELFLENSIFNPILSSSYRKDNIITKFISNKDCITEIEKSQNGLPINSKLNIIYIYIHTFFYNTLITCIYPLLFIYIRGKNYEHLYTFLIIALTYMSSFLFMIVYHKMKIVNIKLSNTISYLFCILGSISYVFSILFLDEEDGKEYLLFGFILVSRILIGLGNNIMLGKKYITLFTPRYFMAKISLFYLIFQILGLAFGPLIGIGLLSIPEKDFGKLKYNSYNCIGWYGCAGGIICLLLNIFMFTKPGSSKLLYIKNLYNSFRSSNFGGDFEDTMDKEFYDMKHQIINNNGNSENNYDDKSDEESIINTYKEENIIDNIRLSVPNSLTFNYKNLKLTSQKSLTIYNSTNNYDNNKQIENNNKRTATENDLKCFISDESTNVKEIDNPLSINVILKEKENNNQTDYLTDFNKINMIPRTLDDIIRKEKQTFGYINHNLLMLFLLLFFNNMIKENYIAFVSYYITDTETFLTNDKKINLDLNRVKLTCLLTGCAYLSELLSLFFIFPFYKINSLFKKYAIILMTSTIILMLTLSILIYYKINSPYFIIVSFLILINMTLEVVSSSYLSYLLPPTWKFKNIRAGALTIYIMTFGKIFGILFCLISYSDSTWNYFGMTIIISICYTSLIIYLYKSPNLRIKAICRIIQLRKLEELIV